MHCQSCQKNPITVQVFDVVSWAGHGAEENQVELQQLCELCVAKKNLPFAAGPVKATQKLWDLLNLTANAPVVFPGPRPFSNICRRARPCVGWD